MSSFDGEETEEKYVFKRKFGADPTSRLKVEETSHEEVDAFVKGILRPDKEQFVREIQIAIHEPTFDSRRKPVDEPKT